jgi:hypothetical protein
VSLILFQRLGDNRPQFYGTVTIVAVFLIFLLVRACQALVATYFHFQEIRFHLSKQEAALESARTS